MIDSTKLIDILHAVVEDKYPLGWDSKKDEIRISATRLLDLAQDAYVHVVWPHSQRYMEQDWFEKEAALDTDSPIGSCYFIPLTRVLELQD